MSATRLNPQYRLLGSREYGNWMTLDVSGCSELMFVMKSKRASDSNYRVFAASCFVELLANVDVVYLPGGSVKAVNFEAFALANISLSGNSLQATVGNCFINGTQAVNDAVIYVYAK